MSSLFVSHSSADAAQAQELQQRLVAQGHRSVFLDFDPQHGIPAGRDWEQELYRQLRACQAVIVLCSEQSMASQWVFAELTHAKALGKPLFPIVVSPCTVHSLLTAQQVIDLTADPEEGYRRLWQGLAAAGLDPARSLGWDGVRPPYPGLMAFEEADAGMFFGRDAEIQQGMELLNQIRQFGGARSLMVLGASGSGKSSLVRAGLIPRLRLNPDAWLILPPMRPLAEPFRELAVAFAEAFEQAGQTRDWRELSVTLKRAATSRPIDAQALLNLAVDLRLACNRRNATLVLPLDQLEEALSYPDGAEENAFLPLLQAALAPAQTPLLVIATLRSDYLGQFQQHPSARVLQFQDLRVGPLAADQWTSVIEGPALRAGVDLEPGLTSVMIGDTKTEDALPLLAFSLHELYERCHADGRLSIEEYRSQLGGLGGSVAKVAEAVFNAESLTPPQIDALRDAFLELVRLNDEGRFARQAVPWARFSPEVGPTLERFVQARLLISRGEPERVLEVTHEALFRNWDRLRGWLEDDREFIRWRQRLEDACRQWLQSHEDSGALLRGAALAAAERWLAERAGRLSDEQRRFVAASLAAQRRAERRRRRLLQTAVAAAVLFVALAVVALSQWRQAVAQRQIAVARQLATQALADGNGGGRSLETSLLLAVESLNAAWTPDGYAAWAKAVELLPRRPPQTFVTPDGQVDALAVLPNASAFLAFDFSGTVLYEWPSGNVLRDIEGMSDVRAAEFSPDGTQLAVATFDALELWNVEDWSRSGRAGFEDNFSDLAFSPNGELLALGSESSFVRLFETPNLRTREATATDNSSFTAFALSRSLGVAFDPNGAWLTVGDGDGVSLWSIDEDRSNLLEPGLAFSLSAPSFKVRFNGPWFLIHEGSRLHAWPWSYLRNSDFDDPDTVAVQLDASEDSWTRDDARFSPVAALQFSADGRNLGYASDDGRVLRIVDAYSGDEQSRLVIPEGVKAFAFAPGDEAVIVADERGLSRWPLAPGGALRSLPTPFAVESLSFSANGRWLAAGGENNLRVVELATETLLMEETPAARVERVAFAGGEGPLAVVEGNRVRLYDTGSWTLNRVIEPVDFDDARLLPESFFFAPQGEWFAIRTSAVTQRDADGARHLDLVYPSKTTIWDSATGELLAWRTHEQEDLSSPSVEDLAVSPDVSFGEGGRSELLALASQYDEDAVLTDAQGHWEIYKRDGSVTLAEAVTARDVTTLAMPYRVESMALSADGNLLATGARDGIRLWLLGPVAALAAEACGRLSRNLGREERTRYGVSGPTCPTLATGAEP
jgi:WD40 repeat protein